MAREIRPIAAHEVGLLRRFLYLAIYQPDPANPIPPIVLPEWRGQGVGSELVARMLEQLRLQGYSHTSLSVQGANPALRLYERLGFRIAAEHGDAVVMLRSLGRE